MHVWKGGGGVIVHILFLEQKKWQTRLKRIYILLFVAHIYNFYNIKTTFQLTKTYYVAWTQDRS